MEISDETKRLVNKYLALKNYDRKYSGYTYVRKILETQYELYSQGIIEIPKLTDLTKLAELKVVYSSCAASINLFLRKNTDARNLRDFLIEATDQLESLKYQELEDSQKGDGF